MPSGTIWANVHASFGTANAKEGRKPCEFGGEKNFSKSWDWVKYKFLKLGE